MNGCLLNGTKNQKIKKNSNYIVLFNFFGLNLWLFHSAWSMPLFDGHIVYDARIFDDSVGLNHFAQLLPMLKSTALNSILIVSKSTSAGVCLSNYTVNYWTRDRSSLALANHCWSMNYKLHKRSVWVDLKNSHRFSPSSQFANYSKETHDSLHWFKKFTDHSHALLSALYFNSSQIDKAFRVVVFSFLAILFLVRVVCRVVCNFFCFSFASSNSIRFALIGRLLTYACKFLWTFDDFVWLFSVESVHHIIFHAKMTHRALCMRRTDLCNHLTKMVTLQRWNAIH